MSEGSAPSSKWFALVLLATTQFVIVLDASIVNVALPSIGKDLQLSQDDLSWVVNAYVLTFGGFLLLGGRLADLLGRRRMFISGLILFGLASLAGGLSSEEWQLIAARAVQGTGAAIIAPAALSLITTTYREGKERNTALGVWGAVAGAGGAAGVLLGGVLTEYLGWEWVLLVNVPIAAGAAFLAPRLLEESRDESAASFDVPGAVSVTAGLAVLVYALVDAEQSGWGSTKTISLLVLAVLLLAAFVGIESRTKHPLMPFSIFRLRTLRGANLSGLLVGASLFSMFYFISLYLQQVLGDSPVKAGLSYLPLSLVIILSAGIASNLVTKVGFKVVLVGGLISTTLGLLWFTQVSAPDGSYLSDVLGPSILVGAGLGFSFVPVTIAAVTGIDPSESGLASGLINTAQQVGGALGLAITATVANSTTRDSFASGERNKLVALTDGFQDAFLVCAGLAALGAVLAATIILSRDSREHAEAAQRGEADAVAV